MSGKTRTFALGNSSRQQLNKTMTMTKRLDVITAAARTQANFTYFCKNECFNPIDTCTTFMGDFTTADYNAGVKDVRETYGRVKKEWLGNYKYWVELICVLNHKCWAWFGDGKYENPEFYWEDSLGRLRHPNNEKMYKVYKELYGKAEAAFWRKYKNDREACSYHFKVTD